MHDANQGAAYMPDATSKQGSTSIGAQFPLPGKSPGAQRQGRRGELPIFPPKGLAKANTAGVSLGDAVHLWVKAIADRLRTRVRKSAEAEAMVEHKAIGGASIPLSTSAPATSGLWSTLTTPIGKLVAAHAPKEALAANAAMVTPVTAAAAKLATLIYAVGKPAGEWAYRKSAGATPEEWATLTAMMNDPEGKHDTYGLAPHPDIAKRRKERRKEREAKVPSPAYKNAGRDIGLVLIGLLGLGGAAVYADRKYAERRRRQMAEQPGATERVIGAMAPSGQQDNGGRDNAR